MVDPTPASSDEEERSSFWDDFLNGGEDSGGSDFGESNVGAYIETAVNSFVWILFVAALVLLSFFTGKNMIRRVKERRLPARERAGLEYRRLAAYLSRKNPEFAVLRTIKEQTEWINAHCRRGFTKEQGAALYELFFAGEAASKTDARWEALTKHCSRRWSFRRARKGTFSNKR